MIIVFFGLIGLIGLCLTVISIDLKRDLITATAALAGLSSIMFGFFTNLPVALGLVCYISI